MSARPTDAGIAEIVDRIAGRPSGTRRSLARAFGLLRRSRRGMIGLSILTVFGLAALFAPLLASQDPTAPSSLGSDLLASPSWSHPLGTDEQGKDVLSLLLYGGQVSLAVGLIAAAIATTLGTALGILAGFVGGFVDRAIVVIDDWFLVIPFVPIAILIISLLGEQANEVPLGQAGIMAVVIGFFGWAGTSRVVRSEVLSLRGRTYVDRAKALGASDLFAMRRHIVPNVMPLVFANTVLFVSGSILAETTLAFLGLGDPLRPSWGTMLSHAYANDAISTGAWWYFIAPGICVTVVVMAFALLGYALEALVDRTVEEGSDA